jgi:hypothetical protein
MGSPLLVLEVQGESASVLFDKREHLVGRRFQGKRPNELATLVAAACHQRRIELDQVGIVM